MCVCEGEEGDVCVCVGGRGEVRGEKCRRE